MKRYRFLLPFLACVAFAMQPTQAAETLSSPASGITIKTCDHDAGAICSLTWNGKQFIDDYDHGRQLQSAVSFDGKGENENPTESGASYLTDGFNPRPSSSRLLASDVTDGVLSTASNPAYWNPLNGRRTSNILFTKRVEIGLPIIGSPVKMLPSVISYETSYTIPTTETHTFGTFEVLTAYIPREFSSFWTVDVYSGVSQPMYLSDGPGEQPFPVVIATPNGQYAIGIYSPKTPQPAYMAAGYGRWRHPDVVKWNNVYRIANPRGTLRFKSYVVVGTLASVSADLVTLHNLLKAK